MIIKNPTDQDIKIAFKGKEYSVEANGSTGELSDDVIDFWKSIHSFLLVEGEVKVEEVEEPVEVVEEIKEVEEVVEEEVVEEVKKPKAKKAKKVTKK